MAYEYFWPLGHRATYLMEGWLVVASCLELSPILPLLSAEKLFESPRMVQASRGKSLLHFFK
jgi:hypothetical protein